MMRNTFLNIAVIVAFFIVTLAIIRFGLREQRVEVDNVEPAGPPTCSEQTTECARLGKIAIGYDETSREWTEFEACLIELDVLGCPNDVSAVIRMMNYYLDEMERTQNAQ